MPTPTHSEDLIERLKDLAKPSPTSSIAMMPSPAQQLAWEAATVLSALKVRERELVEALKPFARRGDTLVGPGDWRQLHDPDITVEDFRRARSAISKAQGSEQS